MFRRHWTGNGTPYLALLVALSCAACDYPAAIRGTIVTEDAKKSAACRIDLQVVTVNGNPRLVTVATVDIQTGTPFDESLDVDTSINPSPQKFWLVLVCQDDYVPGVWEVESGELDGLFRPVLDLGKRTITKMR